ncbi:uncharacterized protein [Physeter macrocephalus]|uniref:Uncharacterized protein n=1 Tax=Physeter macrocephalus TaxID=9755 RepID=A0A455C2P1_PHYMC|nr:uncharacterized protein LOC114487792 [Physeter catodon]|eukprot:XP_028355689.1 uncharacterized protein LOC114487792 [Physeter catodon]
MDRTSLPADTWTDSAPPRSPGPLGPAVSPRHPPPAAPEAPLTSLPTSVLCPSCLGARGPQPSPHSPGCDIPSGHCQGALLRPGDSQPHSSAPSPSGLFPARSLALPPARLRTSPDSRKPEGASGKSRWAATPSPHCISSIDGHLQGRVSPLSRTTSCCPPPLPLLSPILSRVSATGPLHGRFLLRERVLTPRDITCSLTLPSTRHSWGFSRPSDRLCLSCQTLLSLTKDRATSNRLSCIYAQGLVQSRCPQPSGDSGQDSIPLSLSAGTHLHQAGGVSSRESDQPGTSLTWKSENRAHKQEIAT